MKMIEICDTRYQSIIQLIKNQDYGLYSVNEETVPY